MLQDILGISIAIFLFSFVFIFPGYMMGWMLRIFNFRNRTLLGQIVIAITVSVSVSPAAIFIVYRFMGFRVVVGLLFIIACAAIYICVKFYKKDFSGNEYIRPVIFFVLLWLILSVFALVDFQIDRRLYFSSNSYDLTTRVSVVDAISRTGVPPVNPSYYPGRPVLLNSLYYYWYILASIVDQIGGGVVSAFHAMMASISWAGIILFATLATYLRVRDNQSSRDAWKKSFIAIQLTLVGGLDFLMVLMIMASFNFHLEKMPFQEQTEGWNMPIMSWVNALAWVPHHLAAALACVTAMLIMVQNTHREFKLKILDSIIIGLAFASAFGLSVWVMFVFGIFWLIWGAILVIGEQKYQQVGFMILGAVFGVIFASPFIVGILQDGGASGAGGGLPVAFYVRSFMITDLLTGFPPFVIALLNLLFLPLNYLFELGFFFLMAVFWFQEFYKRNKKLNPMYQAELILVLVSIVLLSFIRSTIIVINDLGIRGWLPMQIILVIWASDIIVQFSGERKWVYPGMFRKFQGTKTLGLALGTMLVIGYLTMGLELFTLRTWSFLADYKIVGIPNKLSPDFHLGERTYSGRLAYNYLQEHVPPGVITQNNPLGFTDRASGLYGSHQMVISDRTVYGIPLANYQVVADEVGTIFIGKIASWDFIDTKCEKFMIDMIIVRDIDPLWNNLKILKEERLPLYINEYYAIYPCGK